MPCPPEPFTLDQEVDAAEKNHAVHFPPSAATPAVAEVMSPILTEHFPDDAKDVGLPADGAWDHNSIYCGGVDTNPLA